MKRKDRHENIYTICGNDKFSREACIKDIIEKHEDPAVIKFNSSSIDKAVDEIRFKDLFNPSKIIIIEHDVFHEDKKDQDLFVSVLRDAPEENSTIFICPKLLKSSSIYKRTLSKGNVFIYDQPKGSGKREMVQYVSKTLESKDVKISNDLIYLMVDLIGLNASNVLFEACRIIERFGKINEKIIKDNVKKTYFSIFDLMDSFSERDIKRTLTMYDVFINNEYSYHEIFMAIYRQVRLVFMIKLLMKSYGMKDPRYISNNLKVHQFQVQKNMKNINKYSYKEIEVAFNIMVDFQRKIYNNNSNANIILKVMITELMSK